MESRAIEFAFEVFILASSVYVAAQIALEKVHFASLAAIVVVVSLFSLIPSLGWVISLIVFIALLYYVTETPLEGCIWIAFIAKLISFVSIEVMQFLFI
ncbi:hypothetical protein L1D13_05665 [Vibrio tubiashii]|uniref:hypothetical protein n=1 Tax=Vibrio tubiashii TaxID=29498 RepID=UPI001EFEC0B2|nr:hypothetical protein [Vibrio tubiashii]MCG9580206.1 hypothetical protein [Vibrio tubiashii]MCG9613797.1 hypothetical protein [Vibrio tubiashii]MCG9686401.1 hypothetical protein [Vibrio tubiashii]